MLDKSVPYAGLFMHRKAGTPIPSFPLPDGFSYVFFADGDERSWAKIETSVQEFNSEFAALLHFRENFIPHPKDLNSRCLFIENEAGEKVATATSWWSYVDRERRPWLHWVGTDPQYQGLGLGKAIISRATEVFVELEGDVEIFLKTQTWSYKAINIYLACGYEPTDEKTLYRDRRDNCKKAMKILEQINRQREGS